VLDEELEQAKTAIAVETAAAAEKGFLNGDRRKQVS
jgi:hypothetical protein